MKKYHFWFSEEQQKAGRLVNSRPSHCEVHIPGTTGFVTYTECSTKKKPSGLWKDYFYLGSVPGKQFWKSVRINGVLQGQVNKGGKYGRNGGKK